MTIEYQNALAEVNEILKYLSKEVYEKIPTSFLKFVEENKSKDYIVDINPELSLDKQNLLKETRILLSLIYRSYLCSADKKQKFKIDDIIELKLEQIKLNEKYKYENLFRKK
mgnify:FL=1